MDLTGWFSQTITVAPLSSYSGTGAPTFGAQKTIPCRVENRTELVRHAKSGEEVVSSHHIGCAAAVGIEDRIWLPGDSATDPTIAKTPIRVDAVVDKAGNPVYWGVWL